MKGICFTEPLFHRVVKGEKTQTRRVATHQHFSYSELSNVKQGVYIHPAIPKYKVGEKAYLKEPYILYDEKYQELRTNASGIQFAYKYGNNIPIEEITSKSDSKWKNKLFMPESAARYFIEITAVRAERLQDISEEDCIKEGIIPNFSLTGGRWHYFIPDKLNEPYHSPVEAYAALINKISGKGTWEKNPFVWVYDFKLIDKSETIL